MTLVKNVFVAVVAVSFGVFLPSEYSSAANTNKTKAYKKSAGAKSKKDGTSPTVGDLLKNIEKKAEAVNFKKSTSSLPQISGPAKSVNVVNLSQVKPPASPKLYYDENTDEAELEETTDESIKQLYALSNKYSKSTKRGELWLRLAELYVEKARFIEYQLVKNHDKALQNYQEGKTKAKPKLNLSAATIYNRKAIQLYEWFLRDFPNDPKADQALFFLGYNYFELGEAKKGQEYYLRLTNTFPKSMYVSESNFALGEYHFENERWSEALNFYTKVAQQKTSRLYTFGLYKLAWCHYKLNQSKKGLDYLEQVIYEGRKSKGRSDGSLGGVSRIRLATEAIKDLIIFFAEVGDYKNARTYFQEIVGERSTNANLARLAYFYADTGNRQGAKAVFKDLISQDANSIKAYDYQYAIVKMYGASGPAQEFKNELFSWIEEYGPGSNWQKLNVEDKDSIYKANELMESLLRNHVLMQHKAAQNSRTKSSQMIAKNEYEIYFETFKNSANADEMHFFYGELLFDMSDYEGAAQNYTLVVENAPQSQYYDKALLNSLLAYEKRLPNDAQIKKIVGEATVAIEFTPAILDFEKAAGLYLEKTKSEESVLAVKYRMGALYYLFNKFDQAMQILTEIIKKYPKTPYAKFAANHLLDIYNIRQDYDGLQKAADEILSIPEMAKSDIGRHIQEIKLKTDFKLAKEFENKKDYAAAGKAYESFAMTNRTSSLATAALFNAAVNYEKAGTVTQAIPMYLMITNNKAKGGEALANKANRILPVLYERVGQYAKAAQAFESYALNNPKDKISAGYHYNAAIIYDGMNNYNLSVKNYDLYLRNYKGRDRVEVLFLIAKIFERTGQKEKAINNYKQYISSGTKNTAGLIEAHYTIAKIYDSIANKKESDSWYKKTIAVHRNLTKKDKKIGSSYAAEAKFKTVYKIYDELLSIRIPADPNKQGAIVKLKLDLTNRLKNKLKEVIAYDDAKQIVAALTTQGLAAEHMYTALLNSKPPKGLSADELKQYKEGVQKLADPFKEQAVEIYKSAVSRGHELLGYSGHLLLAKKNLHDLSGTKDTAFGAEAIMTNYPDRVISAKDSEASSHTDDTDALDSESSEGKTDSHGESEKSSFAISDDEISKLQEAQKTKSEAAIIRIASDILSHDADNLQALNALGVFYFENKKYGLAKIIFKRALQKHKNISSLYNNLGVIYVEEDDLQLAMNAFKQSIELKAGNTLAAVNLSSIYLKYKDYQRVVPVLEEAYKAMRSDLRRGHVEAVEIANNYAIALMGTGENDMADEAFEMVYKSNSKNYLPYLNYLIFIVEVQKNKKDANRVISKLKSIIQDREVLRKAQDLVSQLE